MKFPRWNFEKFPQADRTLTTQMKSVGEAMAIGRTFKEAFLKAVRSLELGKNGRLFAGNAARAANGGGRDRVAQASRGAERSAHVGAVPRACAAAGRVETLHELTKIDPWFLQQFADIVALRDMAALGEFREMSTGPAADDEAKRVQRRRHRRRVRRSTKRSCGERRLEEGLVPAYKRIDTCAAEFESFTPYMYGTYEQV